MADQEIYVSTDIETDGPIPGPHSMLSLGSVALRDDGKKIDSFAANLETLPGASGHKRTMDWWQSQPDAWATCRENTRSPEQVMRSYDKWLKILPGRPVFVAYPLLFDMMFVYWHQIKFVGNSPFSHSGIDIKTMAWSAMGDKGYRQATKRNMPRHWHSRRRHTHLAIDDAREQGELFLNIKKELRIRQRKDQ